MCCNMKGENYSSFHTFMFTNGGAYVFWGNTCSHSEYRSQAQFSRWYWSHCGWESRLVPPFVSIDLQDH